MTPRWLKHPFIIGAAIVIASGLFVFARERTLGKQTDVPVPVD